MAVNNHPGTVVSAIFALISGLLSASIAAFMVTRTIKNSRAVATPHLDRLDKTVKIFKDYPDDKFLQEKGKPLKEKLLDSIEIYSKRSLFEASTYAASHGNKRVLKYFNSCADSLIYGKANPSPPLFWNFVIIILGSLLSVLYLLSSLFFILFFIGVVISLKLGGYGFSGGDLFFIVLAYIINSTAFMFCNYLIYKVFPWHAVVKSSRSEDLSMFNLKFSVKERTFLLSELSFKLINFEFLENLTFIERPVNWGVDKFLNRNEMKVRKNLNFIWFFPLLSIIILFMVILMVFANLLIYPIKYLFYAIV